MADKLAVIQSEETIKELELINKKTQELVATFVELSTKASEINKGLLSGRPKEMIESMRELTAVTKEYTQSAKILSAAEQQINKARKDNAAVIRAENLAAASTIRLKQQEEKAARQLGGAYDELNKKHKELRANAANMGAQHGIMSKEFIAAAAAAHEYDQRLKQIDFALGQYNRNVGNYKGNMLGLNMQMQQVLREVPNFALSAQIGIAALSNNLPYLADAISEVSQKNKAMRAEFLAAAKSAREQAVATALAEGASEKAAIASGKLAEAQIMANYQAQKAPPLWKQVASSILNWQTLLIVGISVLMLYSKEISEWTSNIFRGTSATNGLAQATSDLNEVRKEANKDAAKEISNAEMLYRIMKDETIARKDRLEAAKELQEMYPRIFGNMTQEQMLVGDTTKKYNELRDAIIASAMAEAIRNKIAQRTQEFLDKEQDNLDKIGQQKIKISKLESGPQSGGRVFSGGIAGTGTTIESTSDRVRWAKDDLNQMRKTRQDDINSYNAYIDKMYQIGKKYEVQGNQTNGIDKPTGGPSSSGRVQRLSNEQRDAIDLAMAWRDNEIAANKEHKLKLEITEKEYWDRNIQIQMQYRDRIIDLLNDGNARAQRLTAAARKKAMDELEKSNKEIFDFMKSDLDGIYKLDEQFQQRRLELSKEEGFLNNVTRIQEQSEAYTQMIVDAENYYNSLIELATKYGQDATKIEYERDLRVNELYNERSEIVSKTNDALKQDINDLAELEESLQKVNYEEQRRQILNSNILNDKEKSFRLEQLEREELIKNNDIEIKRLKSVQGRLAAEMAIAQINGRLDPKTVNEYNKVSGQISELENENTQTTTDIDNANVKDLIDRFSPAVDYIKNSLSNLGLDSVVSQFDDMFEKILKGQMRWSDAFGMGMALVSDAATQMVQKQSEERIAALDNELESTRARTEQEIEFINERLEWMNSIQNMTEEQIAQRNALEDEARVLREQQMEREKMIEAQKARAIQRANAQQTLIAGIQGSVMAYLSQLIPGDPTSIFRGMAAAAATLAFAGLNAGLIMSKDPVPKYFKGRDGGKAEWALTQEKGREIITDKHGNIKSIGNDKGATMTWLDEGDKVLTADQTQKMLAEMSNNPKLDLNKIAKKSINPMFVNNQNIDYDKLADKIGARYERVVKKYDKITTFENEKGEMFQQELGKLPQYIGRKKPSNILVKINNKNVRD